MTKLPYGHLLIIVFLGLAVYSNSLIGPFVYDDRIYILENAFIRDLSNFTDFSGTRYVAFFSFALNYALGGYNASGYKLVNILIHVTNSLLVYWFAWLVFHTPRISNLKANASPFAFIVSLLFLTHPVQTQAVNYVTQRFAILTTFFYLLSVCLYLRARATSALAERGSDPLVRPMPYALSLIACVLAQKTKEISFTLPFILLIIEFSLFDQETRPRKYALYILPFLSTLIMIPSSILGSYETEATAAMLRKQQMTDLVKLKPIDYLTQELRVVVTYLRLMVFPAWQNLLYDYPRYGSLIAAPVITSAIFLSSIFLSSLLALLRSTKSVSRTNTLIGFGIIWFFVTASIESSVIPIRNVIFEHRIYLPSVGFMFALGALFLFIAAMIERKHAGGVKWAPVAIAVLLLSVMTHDRNEVWSDKLRLWQDVVRKSPALSEAHNNLANEYQARGMPSKALYHYREAIRLNPQNYRALSSLATVYSHRGDSQEALKYYLKAIEINPGFGDGHYNLGKYYQEANMPGKAALYYEKAIRLNPYDDMSYNNLAVVYYQRGDRAKAVKLLRKAVSLNRDNRLAVENLKTLGASNQ
jgi:tetratricopeptide (TPR) repeat protein